MERLASLACERARRLEIRRGADELGEDQLARRTSSERLGDGEGLYHYSNREDTLRRLSPGIYGLSNHLLDTPWPKVVRGKAALAKALSAPAPLAGEPLLGLLADRSVPPDEELPETGVGLAWERILASAFIVSPRYGTRASSLLLIDAHGHVTFVERGFSAGGRPDGESRFEFESPAWARPWTARAPASH